MADCNRLMQDPSQTCSYSSRSVRRMCSISVFKTSGNQGLSRQVTRITIALGGGFAMNSLYVGSSSKSGLKLTQIELFSFLMVGIRVFQLSLDTLWASSIQQTSTASALFIFATLCRKPAKVISVPFRPMSLDFSTV